MGRPAFVLIALALWLPYTPAGAKDDHEAPPVGSTAEGTYFVAHCHFEDDAVAATTAKAADEAWSLTLQLMRRKAEAPAEQLPVHVYGSVTDYVAAERKLTNGRYATNRGFSHFDTRATYIALLPDCDRPVRAALGVRPHFLRQVIHEASHLTVYETVPNHQWHPDWLAEGIATWVAEEASRKLGWSKAGAETPFYSQRMHLCQRMRAKGTLLEPRAILQDHVGHLGHDEQYAIWWAFYRFLTDTHRAELDKIVDAALRLGGGPRFTERLYAHIRTIWDDAALDELNNAFRRYVDAYEPQWYESYRCLEPDGDTWTQVAFSDNNAIAWRNAPTDDRFVIEGTVRIAPSRSPQANVYVGRRGNAFFSVAFRVGTGVTVLEFRDGQWTNHKHVDRKFVTDEPIPFKVRVWINAIDVSVGDEQVIEFDLPRKLTGRWGVGVQAGGGAVWKGVALDD